MIFAEDHARTLLVLHALLALALVASSTHLVLWMRRWPGGQFRRYVATRRFAYVTFAFFAATFLLGNLIYPVYKVRVRVEYLDNPAAVAEAERARAAERTKMRSRWAGEAAPAAKPVLLSAGAGRTAQIARWFDVKEHWVALGLALSAACATILTFWNPARDGGAIAPIVLGLALAASASAWFGAIIGLVTASYRAVGA